jgi:hypothetical protein
VRAWILLQCVDPIYRVCERMDVATPVRIVIDVGSAASKAHAVLLRHEADDIIKNCSEIFRFTSHNTFWYCCTNVNTAHKRPKFHVFWDVAPY